MTKRRKKIQARKRRPLAETRAVAPKQAESRGIGSLRRELEKQPGVTIQSTATAYPTAAPKPATFTVTTKRPSRFAAARARFWSGVTQPETTAYEGLNKWYREYRRDALVRGCVNALAYWATKEGFEVIVEPPEELKTDVEKAAFDAKYEPLKAYVNEANERVNLDWILRVAVIKGKVWGKAPFEKERGNAQGEVTRLIPLDPGDVEPEIDADWRLTGFTYNGQRGFYDPDELLYFVNSAIEADYEGLSDVEPILDMLETRGKIIREDLKEAATTMWAGIGVACLDADKLPAGTTREQVQDLIDDFVDSIRPGKWIATDARWTINVHDLKPDLDKLLNIKKDVDRDIMSAFQVPRFILNREETTYARATALAELEAFADGPITDIQRWLKRTVEQQWYDPLTREWFRREAARANPLMKALRKIIHVRHGQEEPLPVRVVHRWRQIRTQDFYALLDSAAKAYGEGLSLLTREKAYELMRDGQATKFDPEEVKPPKLPALQAPVLQEAPVMKEAPMRPPQKPPPE